jgi:hypothetical protein
MKTTTTRCYKYCVYDGDCDIYDLKDDWLGTIHLREGNRYGVEYNCGCNWLPVKLALRLLDCEMYAKEEIQ